MKALIQRVTHASVTVADDTLSSIGRGLLVFLGVEKGDDTSVAGRLSQRVCSYRVFPDDSGRMNLSLLDTGGSLLIVPQFTLAADTRSGTRPGFSGAAPPGLAETLYEAFSTEASSLLGQGCVAQGRFGADMQVSLTNHGPVTFLLQINPL